MGKRKEVSVVEVKVLSEHEEDTKAHDLSWKKRVYILHDVTMCMCPLSLSYRNHPCVH